MSQVAKKKWIVVSMIVLPALLIALFLFVQAQAGTGTPAGTIETGEALKMITLPAPNLDGKMSLEKVLATRRSSHSISGKALTNEQLGQLAWSGQGITEKT